METAIFCNDSNWKRSAVFPEHYLVSRFGEVYSIRSKKIIRPNIDKYGYYYYTLCVDGDRRTIKGHRLVALTYIKNPQNKPTVNHKNGIRTDNRVDNLEWMTNKEQSNDALTYLHLLNASKKTDYKLMGSKRNFGRREILVYRGCDFIGEFPSQHDAAIATGVSDGKVSQCANGNKKSCRGYTFKLKSTFNFSGEED